MEMRETQQREKPSPPAMVGWQGQQEIHGSGHVQIAAGGETLHQLLRSYEGIGTSFDCLSYGSQARRVMMSG
jgi:hypothetical protein